MTRIHKEQINNPYLCPDVINIIIDKIITFNPNQISDINLLNKSAHYITLRHIHDIENFYVQILNSGMMVLDIRKTINDHFYKAFNTNNKLEAAYILFNYFDEIYISNFGFSSYGVSYTNENCDTQALLLKRMLNNQYLYVQPEDNVCTYLEIAINCRNTEMVKYYCNMLYERFKNGAKTTRRNIGYKLDHIKRHIGNKYGYLSRIIVNDTIKLCRRKDDMDYEFN